MAKNVQNVVKLPKVFPIFITAKNNGNGKIHPGSRNIAVFAHVQRKTASCFHIATISLFSILNVFTVIIIIIITTVSVHSKTDLVAPYCI